MSSYKQINKSTNQLLFRATLYLIAVLIAISACVPNRKYQYLQKDDVNAKKFEIPKDSILRNYDVTDFEYRIQSEDILSITFKSLTNPEYNFFIQSQGTGGGNNNNNQGAGLILRGYLVDENGEVEFPVVGRVKVAGLTIYEAQNVIQGIADNYLDSPVVDVRILNFRFTVLGEVRSQGVITSLNNRTSLLEGLGMAGGLGELADRHNVKIIRQEGRNAEVYYVDLLDENFVNSPFYYLNQNDIIVVPPLKQRPFRVYFSQNLAIIVSSISFLLLVYGIFFQN